MTGRQPLQSAANLPLKPSSASQLRPGGGFTKPASQPVRPVTLPSGPKPHHHPSSKPQTAFARPGPPAVASDTRPRPQTAAAPSSRAQLSGSGGKPPAPSSTSARSTAPTSSAGAKPSESKTGQTGQGSSSLGATFGKASGDKQHRWKLEDFDIGRPLGKVRHYVSCVRRF